MIWSVERGVTRGCPCVLGESDLSKVPVRRAGRASLRMQLSHTVARCVGGVRRSESGVVGGLVPVLGLARSAGLQELADAAV